MTKFSFLFTVALATIISFASCSSDNDNHDGGPSGGTKTVKLTVKVGKNAQLRSTGASAAGITPDVKDLTLYFHDASGNILSTQEFPLSGTLTGSVTETFTVPAAATAIYAIGNNQLITGSITFSATPTTVAQLKTSIINIDKQTDPKTAVNVKGSALITGSPASASIDLVAAVSRIEVTNVRSEVETGAVKKALTSFKIADIYINNTYTRFALDEETLTGLVAADILNYDKSVWATNVTNYANAPYSSFHDAVNVTSSGSVPTVSPGASSVWGYFVPATIAGKGTTFPDPTNSGVSDPTQQTAVPHIILKIENATADGVTLPAVQYVTVKGLIEAGTPVTNLKAGYFYIIKSLNIGVEHLTTNPEDPKVELNVTVQVKPWEEVEVKPEI